MARARSRRQNPSVGQHTHHHNIDRLGASACSANARASTKPFDTRRRKLSGDILRIGRHTGDHRHRRDMWLLAMIRPPALNRTAAGRLAFLKGDDDIRLALVVIGEYTLSHSGHR
jgi:hypothetical protein